MVLNMGRRSVQGLDLPEGFRFNPTDEELVWHYLRRKAKSEPFQIPIIADVDLYKFDPWDLPEMALFGEKEWFFFSPRDRKYPKGKRPNRAAASGYWKATGTDKPVHWGRANIGVKKSLVFYEGRASKGSKTDWIMHEYRLVEGVAPSAHHHRRGSLRLDDWVLCRIYKKSTHAQRAGRDVEPVLEISDAAHDQAALMEGMLGADTNSEDGSLTTTTTSCPVMNALQNVVGGSTSFPVMNASHNVVGGSASVWEMQLQAMASTSRGPTLLDKTRFVQQLEAAQTLNMAPSMAAQFPSRSWHSTYADLREPSFNPVATMIRSPLSEDESQSTIHYGLEPLYPPAPQGYDRSHGDNSSFSRIPDFSYDSPGTLNYD